MSVNGNDQNNNLADTVQQLSQTEINGFEETLNGVIDRVFAESDPELNSILGYVREIYEYNVLNGKHNRIIFLVNTFKTMSLKSKKELAPKDLQDCLAIGVAIEIFQASALMLDDIMDQSITRRGQLCWYKKTGMLAINDAFLLEQHIYEIIRITFSGKPIHLKLMEAFHKITQMTIIGQLMDLKSMSGAQNERFNEFSEKRLETIYKYKTSYYSFVFPVKLGMILSGCDSEEELKVSEIILLKVGHLFQMQDDFLDCFGDPEVTGKVGTDIEEGKCCWPIVQALKMADEQQSAVLVQNYGIKDEVNVKSVKRVYEDLNLRQLFEKESNDLRNDIKNDIKLLKPFCPQIYEMILSKIVKRNK